MKKVLSLGVCVCLLAVLLVGCGETYDIETDTDFHNAIDKATENALRGEEMYDQIYEEFSDRYTVEEIDQFALAVFKEAEEELLSKIDELNQKVEDLTPKRDEYLAKLDTIEDVALYDILLEEYSQFETRLEELQAESKASDDLYRIVEILEETVTLYEGLLIDNIADSCE